MNDTPQAGPTGAERRSSRDGSRHDHFVQSLERGLAVIRCFDAEAPELTLSEVARSSGLTRAAARRFLLTLADLGYVQTDGRLFSLTPRVLELGYAYLSSLTLPEIAEPHLETLVGELRESSSMSVLDGDEIVYVARVPVARIVTISITLGTRLPAYATSMGRVMLAGLSEPELEAYLERTPLEPLTGRTLTSRSALREEIERVRTQGYALNDQEREEGLRSVAVPIHDRRGKVVAAVNVATPANRRTLQQMRTEVLPALQATGKRIEADLGAARSRRAPAAASGS